MSLIPCDKKIGCESDYPLTNYSAEDPDPRTFIGHSTGTSPTPSFPRGPGGGGPPGGGPDRDDSGDGTVGAGTGTGGDPPPLGSDWENPVVTTFATSTESQSAANDDAGNDNVSAMTVPQEGGESGGGIVLNPSRLRPAVYGNDPQTCSTTCPDGQTFSYTVPANKFRALSREKANAAALSNACKLASANRICLGGITDEATVGEQYHDAIVADTDFVPVSFTITSGSIPAWLDAVVNADNVELTGTPSGSDIGTVSFTIEAVDSIGGVMSRGYTIEVSAGAACDPVATPACEVFTVDTAMSVYCDKTDTVFAVDGTAYTSVLELNTSGAIIDGFLPGASNIGCLLYENTNQRLYVGYRNGATYIVSSYNPSTFALINTVVLTGGAGVQQPRYMAYDPVHNKVWVTDAVATVWSLNANTLAQSVVDLSNPVIGQFSEPLGLVYCSAQNVFLILGSVKTAGIGTLGISVWNPVTMGYSFIDAGNQDNGGTICYNSNNGLAYAAQTPIFGVTEGQVLVIDPSNPAGFDTIDLTFSTWSWAVGYNPCVDKVVAIAEVAGVAKAFYINPSDNSFASTFNAGSTLVAPESVLTYDSTNARLWYGTGANTLLKFT